MIELSFEKAKKLAKIHGTPLLVLMKEKLKNNYFDLRSSLPGVELYYAVKANPHPQVLKIIADLGGSFDVSSPEEVKITLNLGINPQRLLYTRPVNKEEEIRFAYDKGVQWFVVDNNHSISVLKKAAPDSNILVRMGLPGRDCMINLSYKFGAQQDEIIGIIKEARDEGLTVKGISFHVGSQCINYYNFVDAIVACRRIFNQATTIGINLDTIDIGGGFPVSYTETVMPIDRFCESINEALERYFESMRIIAEPGRFLIAESVTLIVKVIGKSVRNGVQWYYLDDGLYGSFSGKLFDHCNYVIKSEKDEKKELCVLAGPTCDSFDVIYTDRVLTKLEVGDILLVPTMGAYTLASACHFNGIKPAKLIAV